MHGHMFNNVSSLCRLHFTGFVKIRDCILLLYNTTIYLFHTPTDWEMEEKSEIFILGKNFFF